MIAFTIFGIDVAWYGIIVTTGIIAALCLYMFVSKKRGIDSEFGLEMFLWLIVLAVVFCRVFYVVPRINEYETFWDMINIKEGGLTIIGGIFGGILAILIATAKNKKYSFARVADCVVVALLLGQIIGRWGNYVNGELFGIEITNPNFHSLPFAVYIKGFHNGVFLDGYFCALFLYEGVLNTIGLAIALFLTFKFKDRLKPMSVALFYLIWYGIVRGSLEFLKFDHATFPNTDIGMVQVICYVVSVIGIVLFILLQKGVISFESKRQRNMRVINGRVQERVELTENNSDELNLEV